MYNTPNSRAQRHEASASATVGQGIACRIVRSWYPFTNDERPNECEVDGKINFSKGRPIVCFKLFILAIFKPRTSIRAHSRELVKQNLQFFFLGLKIEVRNDGVR